MMNRRPPYLFIVEWSKPWNTEALLLFCVSNGFWNRYGEFYVLSSRPQIAYLACKAVYGAAQLYQIFRVHVLINPTQQKAVNTTLDRLNSHRQITTWAIIWLWSLHSYVYILIGCLTTGIQCRWLGQWVCQAINAFNEYSNNYYGSWNDLDNNRSQLLILTLD